MAGDNLEYQVPYGVVNEISMEQIESVGHLLVSEAVFGTALTLVRLMSRDKLNQASEIQLVGEVMGMVGTALQYTRSTTVH